MYFLNILVKIISLYQVKMCIFGPPGKNHHHAQSNLNSPECVQDFIFDDKPQLLPTAIFILLQVATDICLVIICTHLQHHKYTHISVKHTSDFIKMHILANLKGWV